MYQYVDRRYIYERFFNQTIISLSILFE